MNKFSKRSLGQNFLIDKKIINLIVKAGDINKDDKVLEVGPGTGALTEQILEQNPKDFTVIEKDLRLVKILKEKFGDQVKIINDDMLKFSYKKYYSQNLIIFGNLPYNISTQVLAKWIKIKDLDKFCKRFILMFQKEVADRILAETNTKNFGRLSIISNWKLKISKVLDIEPNSFDPKPKVKSSLLLLKPKEKFYNLEDPKNLEHITNIFFNQRRKMIKKPIKFLFKNYDHVVRELCLDLKLRPQNLDSNTYFKICDMYENLTN